MGQMSDCSLSYRYMVDASALTTQRDSIVRSVFPSSMITHGDPPLPITPMSARGTVEGDYGS